MTAKVPLQSHALPTELQRDTKKIKRKKDAVFDFLLIPIMINKFAVRIQFDSPDGARTRDLGVAFIRMRIEKLNPQWHSFKCYKHRALPTELRDLYWC